MELTDKNGNVLLILNKEMFPLEIRDEDSNFSRHVYARYLIRKIDGEDKEVPNSLNVGA